MRNIKFISYDGKYPNLCSGTLVYSIDEKEHSVRAPATSGGSTGFTDDCDDYCTEGDWTLIYEKFEDLTKKEAKALEKLFNKNVRPGCCGGCL